METAAHICKSSGLSNPTRQLRTITGKTRSELIDLMLYCDYVEKEVLLIDGKTLD